MPDYSIHSDGELVQLLQQDDQTAFEEIYNRYWKRMLAMGFLRLQRVEEAEDLVQDVFTALWQKRAHHSIQSLENWLSVAVKYKVINRINRRLKKELLSDDMEKASGISAALPDTEYEFSAVEYRFLSQLLTEYIHRLPEKCRIVFQYSREQGLSNQEIAQKLNISEKTVEKHITTARQKLAPHFKNLLQSLFF